LYCENFVMQELIEHRYKEKHLSIDYFQYEHTESTAISRMQRSKHSDEGHPGTGFRSRNYGKIRALQGNGCEI